MACCKSPRSKDVSLVFACLATVELQCPLYDTAQRPRLHDTTEHGDGVSSGHTSNARSTPSCSQYSLRDSILLSTALSLQRMYHVLRTTPDNTEYNAQGDAIVTDGVSDAASASALLLSHPTQIDADMTALLGSISVEDLLATPSSTSGTRKSTNVRIADLAEKQEVAWDAKHAHRRNVMDELCRVASHLRGHHLDTHDSSHDRHDMTRSVTWACEQPGCDCTECTCQRAASTGTPTNTNTYTTSHNNNSNISNTAHSTTKVSNDALECRNDEEGREMTSLYRCLGALLPALTPSTRAVFVMAALWLAIKFWSAATQRISLSWLLFHLLHDTGSGVPCGDEAGNTYRSRADSTLDMPVEDVVATRIACSTNVSKGHALDGTSSVDPAMSSTAHPPSMTCVLDSPLVHPSRRLASPISHVATSRLLAHSSPIHEAAPGHYCANGCSDMLLDSPLCVVQKAEHDGNDYAHAGSMWWDDGMSGEDTMEEVVGAIEEAEMILLRLNDFAVPYL